MHLPLPCKLWPSATDGRGYGQVRHNGKVCRAHRVAYIKHHGLCLEDIAGQSVRHKCDVPLCVEPTHLELGSHADNMQDKVDRGRSNRGTKSSFAVLTDEQVAAIRAEYVPRSKHANNKVLAAKYGVDMTTVSRITSGKTWRPPCTC